MFFHLGFHHCLADAKFRGPGIVLFLGLVLFVLVASAAADEASKVVPATYIKDLSLPGFDNKFKHSARILFDDVAHETFVVDQGNGRIVLFDSLQTFRFEFYNQDNYNQPLDIAVNKDGYLYVLGSTRSGKRIFKYDFDGMFLNEVVINGYNFENSNIVNICTDDYNNLYLLDIYSQKIIKLGDDGNIIKVISVFADDKIKGLPEEAVFGTMSIQSDYIFLPVATFGRVLVYDLDGNYLKKIGRPGVLPGELTFPTAVAVSEDGLVYILDKRRFNVICYTFGDSFLGEFGGLGFRNGWFYFPTTISVDNNNQVYVGQVYNNRIQVCETPGFILRDFEGKGETFSGDNVNVIRGTR